MKFEEIKENITDLKNLPNKKLVEMMQQLSSEHELVKKEIINLTHYFDKIEESYNTILEEYEKRT